MEASNDPADVQPDPVASAEAEHKRPLNISERQILAERLEMPLRDLDKDPYTGENVREDLDFELRHAAEFLRITDPREIESMRMKFFANRYFECMYTAQRTCEKADADGSPVVIREILGARRSFTELMDFLETRYSEDELENACYPYIQPSDVCDITGNKTY